MVKKEIKIVFNVTSFEGDEEYSLLPKEAVKKIKSLVNDENKWLFINGEIKNNEMITEKELIKAQENDLDIFLTTAIAGGNVEKPIEIEFQVSKAIDNIAIVFDEDKYRKLVKIVVSKKQLIDVVYDREVIVKALERKLEEFAEREVEGLRTALNY